MKTCPWEKIKDFRSIIEFRRFEEWMNDQIRTGSAREIEVVFPYAEAPSFYQKWFEHCDTQTVWRLVWPDPPFPGVFEPIADK